MNSVKLHDTKSYSMFSFLSGFFNIMCLKLVGYCEQQKLIPLRAEEDIPMARSHMEVFKVTDCRGKENQDQNARYLQTR